MANLTSSTKFGIKEVADVKFYAIENGTVASDATLTFTTLKVSNIEVTSEETSARGGKGNSKLITWDYNREITLTLQDAILTMDTLSTIFGQTKSNEISIGSNDYPGYFKIEGSTYAKTDEGVDALFTFTIPKAKISSNVTLTMEAEGDPTVFDMTITALKDGDNPLMTLKLAEETTST